MEFTQTTRGKRNHLSACCKNTKRTVRVGAHSRTSDGRNTNKTSKEEVPGCEQKDKQYYWKI